jgi:hypothetical protein
MNHINTSGAQTYMRTMNASREMSPVIVIFLNFRSLPQRFISDENLTVNVAVMVLPK